MGDQRHAGPAQAERRGAAPGLPAHAAGADVDAVQVAVVGARHHGTEGHPRHGHHLARDRRLPQQLAILLAQRHHLALAGAEHQHALAAVEPAGDRQLEIALPEHPALAQVQRQHMALAVHGVDGIAVAPGVEADPVVAHAHPGIVGPGLGHAQAGLELHQPGRRFAVVGFEQAAAAEQQQRQQQDQGAPHLSLPDRRDRHASSSDSAARGHRR